MLSTLLRVGRGRPRRRIAAGSGLLLLATTTGCLTLYYERPYEEWRRADSTPREFEVDRDACIQKATVPLPLVAARGNVAATDVNEEIFLDCMESLGWTLPGESELRSERSSSDGTPMTTGRARPPYPPRACSRQEA